MSLWAVVKNHVTGFKQEKPSLTMTGYKQAILLRDDIGMSRGKMVAQGAHASLKAYRKVGNEDRKSWEDTGEKKIVRQADKEEIVKRFQTAKSEGIPAALVKDAGHTEVDPGTVTAACIGPAEESRIDSITGDLKLIK